MNRVKCMGDSDTQAIPAAVKKHDGKTLGQMKSEPRFPEPKVKK